MNTIKNNPAVLFGDLVRRTRIENGLTARQVARVCDMQPSNFSKLEHGILAPPRDAEKLRTLAMAVGLNPGSAEASRFFDLAAAATNSTPVDLADIISRNDTVPLLLRTIGNKRLTPQEIARLVEIVHQK